VATAETAATALVVAWQASPGLAVRYAAPALRVLAELPAPAALQVAVVVRETVAMAAWAATAGRGAIRARAE
jgi:hypothetical protein